MALAIYRGKTIPTKSRKTMDANLTPMMEIDYVGPIYTGIVTEITVHSHYLLWMYFHDLDLFEYLLVVMMTMF